MKVKVCGMKYMDNILQVGALQPDYMGFIFYKNSTRYIANELIPALSQNINKVGVFVDASLKDIEIAVHKYHLQVVQLHGEETPSFCKSLQKSLNVKIIKAFPVNDYFDFSIVRDFEPYVSFFLFDTQGKLPGGNGYSFNWSLLESYPSNKPFFLSGGISLDSIESFKKIHVFFSAKHCHAIDLNSRFEVIPGVKDVEKLKAFQQILQTL